MLLHMPKIYNSKQCQVSPFRWHTHGIADQTEKPQCDCSNAPKEKQYAWTVNYDNCPGGKWSPGCQPTVVKTELNQRRSFNHRNSNVNVNTNTVLARRFLDDDERGNVNINTNGDNADLDAAILLKNLGFIFPRTGYRHHQNHKRNHRNHAASNNHGQRNRKVMVRTNGRDVGVFEDTNDNDDDIVYVIDDDAADSPDNDAEIVAASRRSPFHPHDFLVSIRGLGGRRNHLDLQISRVSVNYREFQDEGADKAPGVLVRLLLGVLVIDAGH
ncbi:hypothetical protein KQX54_002551 [Cotesia glomerata]|uniref:Uncharacterized protein n=1 Tax=Cotesia glomerata TaxID=32391 RepID=A0AAV7IW36_COTGL|nr:hypothetical protein KQX54_002551 [Cotesia glomerata]